MENKIRVLDIDGNALDCQVIKIIENSELKKKYIVYKDTKDIMASQIIVEKNNYKILPILSEEEWDYIDTNLNI